MASSSSDDDEYAPLSSFLCPIMQELMSDPVCTIDGHSYEKAAITTWFERRITSPLTGTVLGSRTLVPNHTLRHSISQWLEHCSERHRAARRRRARAAGGADASAGREGGAGGSGAGQDECKDGGGGGGGGGGGDGRGLSSSGIEAAVDAREEELNRHMERLALADASAGAGASMGAAVAGRASAGGGGEKASPGAVAPSTAVLPWLRMLRLPEDAAEAYAATLATHGFEDVGALLFVTEAELAGATLGLKMGHARKAAHFLAQLQQGVDAAPAVAVARRHGAPALTALLSDRPFDLAVQQLATEATLELILQAPHDSFDSFAAYRAVRTRAYENGGAKARCRAFIAAGGVRAAVQLLETGVEDGATVFRAVQVLNLFIYQLYSDNEEGAELLRQASCIGPLVLVLKRWYDDTLLLTYCCNSLVGLAYGDNLLRTEIKRLGGIPPIVRALATKLDDDDAVRWALTMLRNVAIYDANKVAIAEAGGVERVLAVLARPRFQHNIPVCEGAFGVLWNISTGNDENREHLIRSDGVRLVIRTVSANLGEGEGHFEEALAKMHGAAVLLLWNVAFSKEGRREIKSNGGRALLKGMSPRFEDCNVVMYTDQLLVKISPHCCDVDSDGNSVDEDDRAFAPGRLGASSRGSDSE